jgi:hypothetical protein
VTKQSLPNKHDIAISFFKLVAFQSNFNWNSLLLLNTASSLEKILDPTGSASGTKRILRQSQNGLPVKGGPLSLLTSSTNDYFGIIQAIKKREDESRFCEKLTYEDFELFIFVENRKLVSLIIDPHQFLNAFDAKKIAEEMNETDLWNLGIGWSSQDRRGKEYDWIVWSPKEKEERIQQLIEFYKEINLSHHLLFKTINELWENDSEIDKKEEFLFDLLPTILILFDMANLECTGYLKNDKLLTGNELYDFNRFCLHYGDYASKSGNLFRNVGAYKHFRQDSSLFLGLMTDFDINARAKLIKNSLVKKTRNLLNKRRKVDSLEYAPTGKGTKRIVKAFYGESVFDELIKKNVIKFHCLNGKITKIIVNIDQLYLYITNDDAAEDKILDKSQLPISSYLFFANNIVKSISEMLLSHTAKLNIDNLIPSKVPITWEEILNCPIRADSFNENLIEQTQVLKGYLKPLTELPDFQEFQNRLKSRSKREQDKREKKQSDYLASRHKKT